MWKRSYISQEARNGPNILPNLGLIKLKGKYVIGRN